MNIFTDISQSRKLVCLKISDVSKNRFLKEIKVKFSAMEGLTTETPAVAPLELANLIGSILLAVTIVLIATLNSLCLLVLRGASGIQDTIHMFMASPTVISASGFL